MSVHPVEYVPCNYCSHPHIGKVEIWQWLSNIGNIAVYEITHQWICLRCQRIQREIPEIREVQRD